MNVDRVSERVQNENQSVIKVIQKKTKGMKNHSLKINKFIYNLQIVILSTEHKVKQVSIAMKVNKM